MKHVMFGSGLALIALTGAALAGQARPQVQPQPQPAPAPQAMPRPRMPIPVAALLPSTQALFDGYVRDNKVPGIVGAFGVGDGPTLFVTAGRIADGATAPAADADSLWRVYSMTKPVTAFAAMLLIEEGKIRLDQPVSDFIPGFKSMRVLTSPDTSLDSVPAARPILIRNLLTHTAGLGYNIITKGPLLKEYERLGILPGAVDAKTEVQARTVRPPSLRAFADRVATLPLIAQPGTKWSYSIGLDVMGAVIEKASGMPFDQFVNTRVFRPLKMDSSYWTVPAGAAGRLVTNYAWVGDTRVPLDPAAASIWLKPPSFPYGGAGLVMSARDYDRFLHMLSDGGTLDGVRVAKAETVRLMMSNLLPAGVTFGGIGGTTGGTNAAVPMGYGAGGSVYLADGPGGFPGKGTYGWGGAAGTIAYIDPSRRFRATVMVNYFPADHWPLRTELARALGQDAARLADERAAVTPGFTGGYLDRADPLRHDPDALARATDWRARLLVLGPGYEPQVGDDGRLGWTSLADAPEDADLVLLGLADGRAHFAAITGEAGGAAFRSPRLLAALGLMADGEAATWAAARSVLDWHARHRFCANCGTPTAPFRAGWGRLCPACATEHFPRTDPVVIMIAEHDGRALLGRQAAWPQGRYSALAGFLEPGEAIEEAVAREIWEEAGVRVRDVRYVASQPWPFPSQLMIACVGQAESDALTLDRNELEDAIWVTRDEVRAVLAGEPGPFLAPPPYAIAHTLLTEWSR